MSFRYEIEENTNIVTVFDENSELPFLKQESWPNGQPWQDQESAINWVTLFINKLADDEAPSAPDGPEDPQIIL